MTHDEAVAALKTYVAESYDGNLEANITLDELLWKVRIAHPHNHPLRHMVQTESAVSDIKDLDDLEIDLTELGL